ncbi:hypothetical protein DNTS_024814 [Danionella cerebrum]|uniref:Ig-like domain-containing protein n=1 Tax=Danionella cerebrum TaxID=2873325 RepID=A0A553QSH3_9TELE|nr:hypothetical protein DNTS_024814 [Danionella translucida]
MMAGMFITLLFLLGLSVCSATITVKIPQKSYKIARGDNVTIPCGFTPQPDTSTMTIMWTATPNNPGDPVLSILTYFYPSKSIRVFKNYKGRAGLTVDITKGQADLQLYGLTNTDTRVYECTVQSVDDDGDSPSDTTNLIVLVAPSIPKCTVQGKTEYFQDITFNCSSEEGTPTPTYKWQIYDVNNMARPNPPKATDLNGVLSLYNISKDASGYYVCTSSNEIRSAKCNLTVAVMPPSMNMASTSVMIGAAAGVLLLFVIFIIICCYCRRRKDKNEEYAMGAPEGEEFTDHDPDEKDKPVDYKEERTVKSADRQDPPDDRSERSYDRRSDYNDRRDRRDNYDDRRDRYDDRNDDRRDQNDDRRDRYDDRRDRYDDRRDRYDDRRDRYDDRRDRYDDRRDQYDDRRDRYDDRSDRYNDRHDRYDDRRDRNDDRYNSDNYSEPYDSRSRPPSLPPNKPKDPKN